MSFFSVCHWQCCDIPSGGEEKPAEDIIIPYRPEAVPLLIVGHSQGKNTNRARKHAYITRIYVQIGLLTNSMLQRGDKEK